MKLTHHADGSLTFIPPDESDIRSPTFTDDFLSLLTAVPRIHLRSRQLLAQGICKECVAKSMFELINLNVIGSAVLSILCPHRKSTGMENLGIMKIDWTRPHGPYSKECIVTVSERIREKGSYKIEDLWWLIDNASQHTYVTNDGTKRPMVKEVFDKPCPLGGSVVTVDAELGIYQVTINID